MKRHLLTAALAIVALGGAVASTANSNTISKSSLVGVFYNSGSGCQQTTCDLSNQGTQCSVAPGDFYDLVDGTCIPGNEIPAPSGNLPL